MIDGKVVYQGSFTEKIELGNKKLLDNKLVQGLRKNGVWHKVK